MRGLLIDHTQPADGKRQRHVTVEETRRHHVVEGVKYSRITGYAMGSRKLPGDMRVRLFVEGEFSYEERVRRAEGTAPGHYWYIWPEEASS